MKSISSVLADLSNRDLIAETKRFAAREREATSHLIAALMEIDTRRLYLGEGCSSLFTYCTQVLHLSEHAAYARIEAARAVRRYPLILDRLVDGSLTLTSVRLLSSHLTAENHTWVLDEARHMSKRDVEQLVAKLQPRPDVATSLRKLPVPTPTSVPLTPSLTDESVPTGAAPLTLFAAKPPSVTPIAPERFKIQFTIDRETYDQLREVQNLARHTIPNGDAAEIFTRALKLLHAELLKKKVAATTRPRASHSVSSGSRHIPAAIKRAVWSRDSGRCAFVGSNGRCEERGFLEFHHVVPYAAGGATDADNLQLRCRAHNVYEAEQFFGPQDTWVLREEREGYSVEPEQIWVCNAAEYDAGPLSIGGFHMLGPDRADIDTWSQNESPLVWRQDIVP